MLAAPCCHHDLAAQLRRAPAPAPYALLTRHGILRERFADVRRTEVPVPRGEPDVVWVASSARR